MSPKFFTLCVDDMIVLRESKVGCNPIDMFVAAILFADDLALLAPTRSSLQRLIDICSKYCDQFCLSFNATKSKTMVFGKQTGDYCPLMLNGSAIEYVHELKYLGTTIKAGKQFSFSARPDISSFYRATNSVLNVLRGAREHTLMHLLYTNCVPILTYACAVKEYTASEMSDCNVAMNAALRKVFGFSDWRSIRALRQSFGFQSIYELFHKAKDRFMSSVALNHNPIIRHIASLLSS